MSEPRQEQQELRVLDVLRRVRLQFALQFVQLARCSGGCHEQIGRAEKLRLPRGARRRTANGIEGRRGLVSRDQRRDEPHRQTVLRWQRPRLEQVIPFGWFE